MPPIATVTLNRLEALNTIVPPMPDEIEAAIGLDERDLSIKVIVLRGAGRAICGGYNFGGGFQHWDEAMIIPHGCVLAAQAITRCAPTS